MLDQTLFVVCCFAMGAWEHMTTSWGCFKWIQIPRARVRVEAGFQKSITLSYALYWVARTRLHKRGSTQLGENGYRGTSLFWSPRGPVLLSTLWTGGCFKQVILYRISATGTSSCDHNGRGYLNPLTANDFNWNCQILRFWSHFQ